MKGEGWRATGGREAAEAVDLLTGGRCRCPDLAVKGEGWRVTGGLENGMRLEAADGWREDEPAVLELAGLPWRRRILRWRRRPLRG